MKRRKVNKKDLVDGNAGMFFGRHLVTQRRRLRTETRCTG